MCGTLGSPCDTCSSLTVDVRQDGDSRQFYSTPRLPRWGVPCRYHLLQRTQRGSYHSSTSKPEQSTRTDLVLLSTEEHTWRGRSVLRALTASLGPDCVNNRNTGRSLKVLIKVKQNFTQPQPQKHNDAIHPVFYGTSIKIAWNASCLLAWVLTAALLTQCVLCTWLFIKERAERMFICYRFLDLADGKIYLAYLGHQVLRRTKSSRLSVGLCPYFGIFKQHICRCIFKITYLCVVCMAHVSCVRIMKTP